MLKINLTNEIYSKQTYSNPSVIRGKDNTVIEYLAHWFWKRKDKYRLSSKPDEATKFCFDTLKGFIASPIKPTSFYFLIIRRTTQILKLKER